jgi:hypothetical protein
VERATCIVYPLSLVIIRSGEAGNITNVIYNNFKRCVVNRSINSDTDAVKSIFLNSSKCANEMLLDAARQAAKRCQDGATLGTGIGS